MLIKLFEFICFLFSLFFFLILNLIFYKVIIILFCKVNLFIFVCFYVINLSFLIFIILFRRNYLNFISFYFNILFLLISFMGCVVCISSSDFLFISLGFFVSSLFGVLCLIKSIKSNSFPFYFLLFFSFLCDSFVMVFVFYYLLFEYGCITSSLFCLKDWMCSYNNIFLLLFFSFSYKSAWFMSGFWVYLAMDAGYFISCFLHSSGVIFLGLCLWVKINHMLTVDFINYVILFCFFGCLINFIFFILSSKFKKSLGILSCLSYNVMFLLLIVNINMFFCYFIIHSIVKSLSFLFVFVFKKVIKDHKLLIFINYFYICFYVLFLICLEVFSLTSKDCYNYNCGHMVNLMLFLESFCYLKFFIDFNYVFNFNNINSFVILSKVFNSIEARSFILFVIIFMSTINLTHTGFNVYVINFYFIFIILLYFSMLNKIMVKSIGFYLVIFLNKFWILLSKDLLKDIVSIMFYVFIFLLYLVNSGFILKDKIYLFFILFIIIFLILL